MTDTPHRITIDRIVLSNLNISPDRGEVIRRMAEVELGRVLQARGHGFTLMPKSTPRIRAEMATLSWPHSDRDTATSLANSIADVIHPVR